MLDHGAAAQSAMLRAEEAANRRTRGLIEGDVDPRDLEKEVRHSSTEGKSLGYMFQSWVRQSQASGEYIEQKPSYGTCRVTHSHRVHLLSAVSSGAALAFFTPVSPDG
ncbi:MAG: hypothetical protein FJX93_00760 [Bacteroidetes bacterium]|nr:hypothetical protein [Bacteroidota bacterium]